MEKPNLSAVPAYLRKHWFNFLLISIAIIIFLRKDLSFQISVNAPSRMQPGSPIENYDQGSKKKNERKKVFTDNSIQSKKTIVEKLDLSHIGGPVLSPDAEQELAKIDEETKIAYLKRFAHVAVSERKKYGIPSSIILANALIHSFAGKRDMALKGNNHFAIACGNGWEGQSGNYYGGCYRHYENAWTSFRDHSIYITSAKFAHLTRYDPTDYRSWAKGLEQAHFSDFNQLASQLIQIIEKYDLQQLDLK